MHHFFLIRLVRLLANYGYVVLFPFAVIEGPVAAIVAGTFVASGEFNFLTVFLVLIVGDLVGDALYYALGRYSHKRVLHSLGAKLGLSELRTEPLRNSFEKHDWKLILFGKTQALGSIILYFAGVTRMSFVRFMYWNLLGTLPKVLLFETVGFFFGQTFLYTTKYVTDIGIATFVVALLLLLGYWFIKRYAERELAKE